MTVVAPSFYCAYGMDSVGVFLFAHPEKNIDYLHILSLTNNTIVPIIHSAIGTIGSKPKIERDRKMTTTIEIVKMNAITSRANGYSGIIAESADNKRHCRRSTGYFVKTLDRRDVTKSVMLEIARITGKKQLSVWLPDEQRVHYDVDSEIYRVVVDDECVFWQCGNEPACTDVVAIADSMGY